MNIGMGGLLKYILCQSKYIRHYKQMKISQAARLSLLLFCGKS